MAAWIGWHDCDPSTRPSLAGQAYVGNQGTQRAEYLAVVHGLQAVLVYARLRSKPAHVILHVDNKTVAHTLKGVWTARGLKPYDDMARELITSLEARGIEVCIDHVAEKHPHHKAAHRMSKNAWHQLFQDSWRPVAKPPVSWSSRAVTSTRRDAEAEFTEDAGTT
jgi:ribonuclease HI